MEENISRIKVAIGSKNPVKIAAVEEAFQKVWPEKMFDFVGIDVPSGVPDQPMSDEESIKGATNRAMRAKESIKADFGVGLEGGLQQTAGVWFDCGWIVIIDEGGLKGIGSTLKIITPLKMMDLIQKGIELGHVNDILFKQKNTKQGAGHFGHMTNGAISRKDGYRDGVISALAIFLHPELM